LDSTFLIDAAKGRPNAEAKAKALVAAGERLALPAPVLAEVMVGAHYRGGTYHRRMVEFLGNIEVLETTADIAMEAGEIGAELMKRGYAAGTVDLIVAATAKRNAAILLTRDTAFANMPGLAVENY